MRDVLQAVSNICNLKWSCTPAQTNVLAKMFYSIDLFKILLRTDNDLLVPGNEIKIGDHY